MIGRAEEFASKSLDRTVRFTVSIISERIRASLGQAKAAKRGLKAILAEAEKYGFVGYQLQARLALGEIETKSGESAAGRARLEALHKDAMARNYGLVARRAAAAKR